MIVPADLPSIVRDEVRALLASRGSAVVTIVPSRDGGGTNAMLLAADSPAIFAFGPDSVTRHRARAEAAGLSVQILNFPLLAFDVDTPQDLSDLRACNLDEPIRASLMDDVGAQHARLSDVKCFLLEQAGDLAALMEAAAALRDRAHLTSSPIRARSSFR